MSNNEEKLVKVQLVSSMRAYGVSGEIVEITESDRARLGSNVTEKIDNAKVPKDSKPKIVKQKVNDKAEPNTTKEEGGDQPDGNPVNPALVNPPKTKTKTIGAKDGKASEARDKLIQEEIDDRTKDASENNAGKKGGIVGGAKK